jgi:hypothetical protein
MASLVAVVLVASVAALVADTSVVVGGSACMVVADTEDAVAVEEVVSTAVVLGTVSIVAVVICLD